jgi:hypothetical protein
MRRPLSIAIICFWLVMLGLLVRRTWPPAVLKTEAVERLQPVAGEEWMGVYHEQQKIGYTHHSLAADDAGFVFAEESLLRLTVLDTPQTVRTRMQGHTGRDFTLRDVEFELSSGAGNLQARGVVEGGALHLRLRTGKDSSEQVLPLQEPLYLPSTLRASLDATGLQPGRQLEVLAFDPTTLSNDRLHLTVEGQEAVPHTAPAIQGWRVHEEFRGLKTTAWVDAGGAVLREEGPMGLALVREPAEQAVNQGWATQTALDLVATAAVPVARPIEDARQRRSLRVRLSGIATDRVPSDDAQMRQGDVLTITRPDTASLQSYALPYRDTAYVADLAPTAFLQSDHPRVRTLAQQIVGDDHDALRAAIRLNDWVYGNLRKVPTISIPNALQVLDMGEGDCNEHAVLLAALARAAGIPTRVIAGTVYLNGAFFYHSWCEVWLGRWVGIDPALHQFPTDVTHIKFVVGGPEEQLAMMDVIGRLGIEVLDGDSAPQG